MARRGDKRQEGPQAQNNCSRKGKPGREPLTHTLQGAGEAWAGRSAAWLVLLQPQLNNKEKQGLFSLPEATLCPHPHPTETPALAAPRGASFWGRLGQLSPKLLPPLTSSDTEQGPSSVRLAPPVQAVYSSLGWLQSTNLQKLSTTYTWHKAGFLVLITPGKQV